MQFNRFVEKFFKENDESGFTEVLFQRQAKLEALRERLKKYYLTDEEIDKLFEIIVNAEIKMENIKRKIDPNKVTEESLLKFQRTLFDIQNKMKEDFDNALVKLLNEKYKKAKKIKAEMDKNNPFN